jgi:hypothetical protein
VVGKLAVLVDLRVNLMMKLSSMCLLGERHIPR